MRVYKLFIAIIVLTTSILANAGFSEDKVEQKIPLTIDLPNEVIQPDSEYSGRRPVNFEFLINKVKRTRFRWDTAWPNKKKLWTATENQLWVRANLTEDERFIDFDNTKADRNVPVEIDFGNYEFLELYMFENRPYAIVRDTLIPKKEKKKKKNSRQVREDLKKKAEDAKKKAENPEYVPDDEKPKEDLYAFRIDLAMLEPLVYKPPFMSRTRVAWTSLTGLIGFASYFSPHEPRFTYIAAFPLAFAGIFKAGQDHLVRRWSIAEEAKVQVQTVGMAETIKQQNPNGTFSEIRKLYRLEIERPDRENPPIHKVKFRPSSGIGAPIPFEDIANKMKCRDELLGESTPATDDTGTAGGNPLQVGQPAVNLDVGAPGSGQFTPGNDAGDIGGPQNDRGGPGDKPF